MYPTPWFGTAALWSACREGADNLLLLGSFATRLLAAAEIKHRQENIFLAMFFSRNDFMFVSRCTSSGVSSGVHTTTAVD